MKVSIDALGRPFNPDEKVFIAYVGDENSASFEAVALTSYAEIQTPGGVVGAAGGSFVVDGPEGIEVLNAAAFGEKYSFGKVVEVEAVEAVAVEEVAEEEEVTEAAEDAEAEAE